MKTLFIVLLFFLFSCKKNPFVRDYSKVKFPYYCPEIKGEMNTITAMNIVFDHFKDARARCFSKACVESVNRKEDVCLDLLEQAKPT